MDYVMRTILCALVVLIISGCAGNPLSGEVNLTEKDPTLMPRSATYKDLTSLPSPAGKIITSVYGFQDQTGQYRPAPSSNFSTAVTQGATAMLNTALKDSGWFVPLEREGLQNLLTERKIIRAARQNSKSKNKGELPPLASASVLLEGGIVAYESNVRTGGAGIRYFGVGGSGKYRHDQVTVNLRAVDIYTGQILHSVNVTKTILSHELQAGVYRFIEFKRLLEAESGYTNNEPVQLCVMSAIEAAVIHLVAQGVKDNSWSLKNNDDISNKTLQAYLFKETPVL